MAPNPNPDTTDLSSLLFARAALSLSRTQRLVSSWLPPPTEAETKAAKASSDVEKEEDGVFAPSSELAGLGWKYTDEDEVASKVLRSDEKLKIQLLGKDWVKRNNKKGALSSRPMVAKSVSKPRPAAMGRLKDAEESSDDEGGRSSLLSKVQGRKVAVEQEDNNEEGEASVGNGTHKPATTTTVKSKNVPKRGASYLDEVLAKKATKEERKRRKKQQDSHGIDQNRDSNGP